MDDLIQEAKELYDVDYKHWSPIYDLAEEDDNFMSGDQGAQWNSKDYSKRKNAGKPALEIDQLSQFEKQVANEIRRNTPAIKVIPNGSDASIDDAEIYRGIIRTIEYRSNADTAYDNAVACAIRSSIGFIKICTDYATDTGFNQELRIERVVNPRSFMIDSRSTDAAGMDAMHAWEEEKPIKVKDFQKQYPDKMAISFGETKSNSDKKGEVRIMRWYRVEEEKYKIGQLPDGTVEEVKDGAEYEAQREVTIRKVKIYRLSGSDVLEVMDFPGKYVPIIPVYGEEAWINGERRLFSLIRRSKDGQRMFNVWKSLEAELLLKQPMAPIQAAWGQTEDFAEEYANPDKVAVLRYKPVVDPQSGAVLPPPGRLAPPQIPSGIVNGARESVDDIKSTMGIYNASLGAQSNETSGVAIQARKLQGDSATYHFGDNLVRSITQCGRVLIEAIPEVYDAPQIIQILNNEEEAEPVGINGSMVEGQEVSHFLGKGKFDIRVTTGSSYATKRMETSALMSEMAKANPEFLKVAGDLFFKYMDVEGAEALSARFKKILPPELQQEDDDQSQDPRVPQMQQIIQHGMQEIQQLQAALQQAQDELKSKQAEIAMKAQDAQSKAQRDAMDIQVKEMQLQIDAQQLQIDGYRAETERLKLVQEANKQPEVSPIQEVPKPEDEEALMGKAHIIAMKQQKEDEKEMLENQQKEAMMQILLRISNNMESQTIATQHLANVISSPRELVRDKNGNAMGTRISGS